MKQGKGYRPHPDGPGYQVRVHPFPAEKAATEDEAAVRAAQLRQYRKAGIRNLAEVEAEGRMTLTEAAAGYKAARYARPGRYGRPLSTKTRKAIARRLDFWTDGSLGSVPVAWLNRGKVEDAYTAVAADRPSEAAALRRELLNVLEWAQARGEPIPPALLAVPSIPVSPRERQALTAAEVDVLAAHAPAYARDTVRFLAAVGGRQTETFLAEPSWFDLKARTWTVPAWACKERREKVIVLTPEEVRLVRRQLIGRAAGSRYVFCGRDGGQWRPNRFHRLVWSKARRGAANAYRDLHGPVRTPYDGLRPHDLRSTAATLMRDAGVPVEIAAARLGHKDGGWLLVTTYKKTTPAQQKAAMDAVAFGHEAGQRAGRPEVPTPERPTLARVEDGIR